VEELDLDPARHRDQDHAQPGQPAAASRWWRLPADGVGLARMEFVVNNAIGPPAGADLLRRGERRGQAREEITRADRGYDDKADFFVETLARGLSRIAAVAYPNPVIVRMSDFKTNEYAELLGGSAFEPKEENPMIGFRGASRYYSGLPRRLRARMQGDQGCAKTWASTTS
jgi:pyruvate,water dikinase